MDGLGGYYAKWDRQSQTEKDNYCMISRSMVAQMVKHLPAMWETQVQSLGCVKGTPRYIRVFKKFFLFLAVFSGSSLLREGFL